MSEAKKEPEILYYFTSLTGLSAIFRSGCIALAESRLNIRKGNCRVVWLTSSLDAKNHGLMFGDALLPESDRTSIRISVSYKASFNHWDEWSDSKGIDKTYKKALVCSAHAKKTYKTWYISECEIPVADFLKIKNMATGEIISIDDAAKALWGTEILNVGFSNEIDEYIARQPDNIQVLLLEARRVIREALPDAVEKISWHMPTYWQGRNIIHFAAQKNHLGIYPGAEAVKYFTPRLIGYRTGKGTIRFPYKSFGTEQLKLIAEIAAWSKKEKAILLSSQKKRH